MSNKAIIFDLNGIFIKSPPLSERIEQDFKIPKEIFVKTLSTIMPLVRTSNAPNTYNQFKPYLTSWNINLTEKQFLNY